MKKNIIFALILTGILIMQMSAQVVQFKVPLTIERGSNKDTLWIGVSGDGPGGTIQDNTYDLDYTKVYGPAGQWSERPYPPDAPDVKFAAKFVDLPHRSRIVATGMRPWDFRGFTSVQQIDSFAIRVYGSKVAEGSLTLGWPSTLSQYGKAWQLLKKQGTNYTVVVKDMTSTTTYTEANAASVERFEYLLIKTGVVPQTK